MTKDYVINPDRFKNFFNELDTRRTLLTTVTDLNNKLFTHLNLLEQTLTNKSRTLDTQIQKFKEHTEKTLESIRIRESGIPEKEVTLAARVQQLKDFAIDDIKLGNNSDFKIKSMSDLLRMWFRRMDCKGLMAYLLANRKKFVELRSEAAIAAEEAVDLLGFVLEAVEEFVDLKVSGKKVEGLAPTRCACGILIQAAFPIPAGGEPLVGGGGVSRSLKRRAVAALERWKGVFSCDGDDGVSSGEAIMFLTMVIGFGLKEEFDEEFLRGLVVEVGGRRDMAKLAVALGGSADKIRGMIEELAKTGKEMEAVYMSWEAGLSCDFSAVELLKSCLENCRKTAKEDVNNELNTTRAVIKCIEDHKLESEFTMRGLRKRIVQLEKVKADKKRSGGGGFTSKPGSNKWYPQRFSGGAASSSGFRPLKSSRVSSGFRQRNHHLPPSGYPAAPYGYSGPGVHENGLSSGSYGVGYSGIQTQTGVGYVQYANYPAQDMGAAGVQPSGSYGGQSNYGSYEYVAPAGPAEPTHLPMYNL